MSKHTFTPTERYAVFTVHGEKCYLCNKPVDLTTMEVDHVIPESLMDDPASLADVLVALGRPPNFDLNSYANWMPACRPCNIKKRDAVFEPSLIVQITLQRAADKAAQARAFAEHILNEKKLSSALNTLEQFSEAGGLPASAVETIRSLVMFHIGYRDPDLAAEPIRLTPDFAVGLEIGFNGGPKNGEVLASGRGELDVHKGLWLLRTTAPLIARVEAGGPKPKSYLTWKQPCKELVELAKVKGWTDDERRARMRHHIYQVTEYEWTDRSLKFKASYEGIE
ncbi:MAG: HNH endonuclease [Thermoguttaceae bacterium]